MNRRELDVLKAMFDAGKEMTSTDIVNLVPDLTQSTTITVMRGLKNKGVIEPGELCAVILGKTQPSGEELDKLSEILRKCDQ